MPLLSSRRRTESHNLLLLRLPSDRVPAKYEEDAGGALPIIHVPGHVRVAETDQLFVAVTGVIVVPFKKIRLI
jgi:hypothetical protein